MQSTLTDALAAFVTRYPDALHAHQRIRGWLLDHAPTERRAVRGLCAVARLELPEDMKAKPKIDPFAFRRWVKRLTGDEALPVDLAEASLLAWATALDVEAPAQATLQGPLDTGMLTGTLDCLGSLHLALEASRVPPVAGVRLESSMDAALRELTVELALSGNEVGSRLRSTTYTGRIDMLRGRQSALLDDVRASVGPHVLATINAPTAARWWLEVRRKDEVLLRTFEDVTVLPPSSWLGHRGPRLAAAAFVQPDDPVVAELVLEAADGADPEDPRPASERALDALLGSLRGYEVTSDQPARDRVFGPRRVFANGGSPLEVALLLAATLEHAGLDALLLEGKAGPAVAVWGSQGRPSLTETDDPELLRRALRGGLLTLVDATTLDRVGESWLEGDDDTTLWAIDLTGARAEGVVPLPGAVLDEHLEALPDGEVGQARQRLLDRAALSDNSRRRRGAFAAQLSRNMAAADVPPRVQGWKNRLLDLTLRNPLLNFRTRSSTVPLIVDDLGGLEDALSSGTILQLVARPPAPRPGQPVPPVDAFMQDAAFASGRVYADLTEARLPKSATSAWRTARTMMDEGGIQAMFLIVGFLKFYEPHRPDVERTAPLLLVPVEMKRKRNGPWRFRRADREPEFNVALLEYLQREHGIELPGVVPLPLDGAGIDVNLVLARVERALADSHVAGVWQVDRAASIGILAFTRVRMWRDLESRSADLLRHPLVRRLAMADEDLPEQPELPMPHRLDERWPAAEIFCPMLTDGSQLSAVAAAHAGHSFVLEGPPGTGKSQTITNIIAHSLAHGRSVLFVSQKRAALEVVHDRLARIGLGPLCLELHSSKARKSEFIDQLRQASQFRARRPKRDWDSRAAALQKLIDELSGLPDALHAEREPGRTVADAIIERWSQGPGNPLPCDFDAVRGTQIDWIDDAKDALVALVDARSRLRVDPEPLDPIRATDWPLPVREQASGELDALVVASDTLAEANRRLSAHLGDLSRLSSDDLDLLGAVLDQVAASPRPKRPLFDGGEAQIARWQRHARDLIVVRDALAEHYKPALLGMDLASDRTRLATWMTIPLLGWLMLWGVRARARLVSLAKRSHKELFEDYEVAEEIADKRSDLESETLELHPLVGFVEQDAWGLPEVPDLDPMIAYAQTLRNRATRFPGALDLASDGAPDGARELVEAWRLAFSQ
jgi:hypothetical protein